MYWLGEATEHHGATVREVWYWSARVYRRLAKHPKAQRAGLDGEARTSQRAMSRIGDEWDIFDCYRDARAWKHKK